VTGQLTHDMFNQPLSNSLAGTIDPATGLDACPISPEITANIAGTGNVGNNSAGTGTPQGTQLGITGRIVTCPKFEADGTTLSPLVGQAVVANMMAGRYSVQAYPAADRIARGEEWLQTNTLDGARARFVPPHRRAELFPGVWAGGIPCVHWLCQPGNHQFPLCRGVRRNGPQPVGVQLHE